MSSLNKKNLFITVFLGISALFSFGFIGLNTTYGTSHNEPFLKVSNQPSSPSATEHLHSISQTSDGGFVGFGGEPGLIVKFDSTGNVSWAKKFGTELNSLLNTKGQQTSDGEYISVSNRPGGVDASKIFSVVTKFDASGNVVWAKKIMGQTYNPSFNFIKQTSDGGYILAGSQVLVAGGMTGMSLVKLNNAGSLQWTKTFDSSVNTGVAGAYLVDQTSDGGYIISAKILPDNVSSYISLIKTTSSGNISWIKGVSAPTNTSRGKFVQQTSDGGYILIGEIFYASDNSYDTLIFKFTSSGNLSWSKKMPKNASDFLMPNMIKQTSDGGYIIGGVKATAPGVSNPQISILKLISNGNFSWGRSVEKSAAEIFLPSLLQLSDGSYLVGGGTRILNSKFNDILLFKTDANGNINTCPHISSYSPVVNAFSPTVSNLSLTNIPSTLTTENVDITSSSIELQSTVPSPGCAPAGNIEVKATLDGSPWTGSIDYVLNGPEIINGTSISSIFSNKTTGNYLLDDNVTGGPANAFLPSITPISSQTLLNGTTIVFTLNFVSFTLSSTLTPTPGTGDAPLSVSLKADVSGTAVGNINYSFWWDCDDAATTVLAAITACGDPNDPNIGAKFDNEMVVSKAVNHTYNIEGSYTAKVIVERGANSSEDRSVVSVSPPPQPDLTISVSPSLNTGDLLEGETLTFKATVENQGTAGTAGDFINHFQIDKDNDGSIDYDLGPDPDTNNLPAGQDKVIISGNWIAEAGTHRVIVCADSNDDITDESDENNNCSPSGSGLITVPPSLALSFTANPASGLFPLFTTLTAEVSGSAQGTTNYSFWWDCDNTTTSVQDAITACGNPNSPSIGAKFDNEVLESISADHTYTAEKVYKAKIIVERDTLAAQKIISVNTACVDECSSSQCVAKGPTGKFKTCGNYDADSCFELSPNPTSCGAGQTCIDGVCKLVPVISFNAAPPQIKKGNSTTVSWNVQNVDDDDCVASNSENSPQFTGVKPASGSASVSLLVNTEYTLTCVNSVGTDIQTVTVEIDVNPGPGEI